MTTKVTVVIDAEGNLSYEVAGIAGQGCAELTAALDAMGTVADTGHTADWNKRQARKQGVDASTTVKAQ